MSTDPIKLIHSIAPTKSTRSTPNTTAAAKSTSSTNDAYKLANSLKELLANGPSGSTALKGNYTAKGVQEAFQSAHDTQTKQAAASATTSKPLDNVLKTTKDAGTNAPTLSPSAQDIVKAKQETSTDVGLAKVDEQLAKTVGIARVIGSA
jgi:hypothetical protein